MDKPKSYIEWHSSLEGFEGLRHANCCKISYEAGQQSRQAEVDHLKGLLEKDEYAYSLYYENLNLQTSIDEKDKRIEELESRLKAVHALARMRSAVINADRWLALRPHIKNAIKCLDRKEKALQGFQGDRS